MPSLSKHFMLLKMFLALVLQSTYVYAYEYASILLQIEVLAE